MQFLPAEWDYAWHERRFFAPFLMEVAPLVLAVGARRREMVLVQMPCFLALKMRSIRGQRLFLPPFSPSG